MKLFRYAVLAAGLAAVVLRLWFFTVSVEHVPCSADECITGLQAKHIAHGEVQWLIWSQPYGFPLEAYLQAPLSRWMPRTTWGIRYIGLLIGLCFTAFSAMVCLRLGALREVWPGVLLALLPSAYFTLLLSAYVLPGYVAEGAILMLALLLADSARRDPASAGRRFLAAALGGLAFCGHMVTAPADLMLWTVLVVDGGRAGFWKRCGSVVAGLAVGVAPFVVALYLFPSADKAVTTHRHLQELLEPRLWADLREAINRGIGFKTPLFPDLRPCLATPPRTVTRATTAVVLGMLAAGLVVAAGSFARRTWRERWPSMGTFEVAVAASTLSALLFLFSRRENAHACRYLLPVVWFLPLIVADLYRRAGARLRVALGGLSYVAVLANVYATVLLIGAWAKPGFGRNVAQVDDVAPLVKALDAMSIDRCYVPYWLAYPVPYYTDERIVSSQPHNDRFPGWPLPYLDCVNGAERVAFVDCDYVTRGRKTFLTLPEKLHAAAISYQVVTVPHYKIYFDFRDSHGPESMLPPTGMTASASDNPERARRLTGRDGKGRAWHSDAPQRKGMGVDLDLGKTCVVSRVTLDYAIYKMGWQPRVDVLAREQGAWISVITNAPVVWDEVAMLGSHPVFDRGQETLRFPSVRCDAVRIQIATPAPRHEEWWIKDIQLYAPLARNGVEATAF